MILPAHMSTANLLHLAHPPGGQLEDLQQSVGIRRSDALLNSSASKVDLLAVQKPQETISAQQVITNCQGGRSIASEFNAILQRNRSLKTDQSVLLSNSYRVPSVDDRGSDNDNDNDRAKTPLSDETLLNTEALQTIVEVSLNISKEAMFNFFLVAILYDSKAPAKQQKHIMLVAPLEALPTSIGNIDISIHSTFVVANEQRGMSPIVTNLPAQLVAGSYAHLEDWMTMSIKPISFNTKQAKNLGFDEFFHINAMAFDQHLNGAATIVGGSADFTQSPVSVHAPGANKLWNQEKSHYAEFDTVSNL